MTQRLGIQPMRGPAAMQGTLRDPGRGMPLSESAAGLPAAEVSDNRVATAAPRISRAQPVSCTVRDRQIPVRCCETGMCSPQLTNPGLRLATSEACCAVKDDLHITATPRRPRRPAEPAPPKSRPQASYVQEKQLLIACPLVSTVPTTVLSSALSSGLTSVFNRTPEPTLTTARSCRSIRLSTRPACAPTDPACLRVSPPGIRHG
jgi:hypothetical protein